MNNGLIGADFRPTDAIERVAGTLRMTLDHTVPGMLHAAAVRSPFPHARLVSVDVSAAGARPGVVTVLTGADLVADDGLDPWFGAQRKDQPVLAVDVVRHTGEPVAIVVAETPEQARQAALDVQADYEELPFVVDVLDAAKPGAPLLHEECPGNLCGSWRMRHGDVARGFAEADRVYEGTYVSPAASHVPMEPHVALAAWGETGLEVWTSAQAPHAVCRGLASIFGLAEERVRVRVFNLGGGYGAKGQIKIEPMVACAARAAGRPVKMELTREEVFQTIAKHAAVVTVKTGVTSVGDIVAREVRAVYNAGAYTVTSRVAAGQGLTRAPGPYRIPHCWVEAESRFTNTVPTGPFRGAMTSQLAFAYESQLDEIAADLGMDPVHIRERNLLRDGDVYATGEALHDLHYDELLGEVRRGVEWDAPSAAAPPGRARGKGLAIIIKNTLTPSRSEARLRLNAGGRAVLYSSSVEMGQGLSATLVQLASTYLGLPPDRIELRSPDTGVTPFDTTTSSSRSTSSMGAAVRDAARRLRDELTRLGAKQLSVPAESLLHEDGGLRVTTQPAVYRTYAALIAEAGLDGLEALGVFATDFGLRYMDPLDVRGPVSVHWHQGAASAEVEVDLETGKIEVLRMHGACYAGKAVSSLRVHQQNQGCMVFGLGPTLFEELLFDEGQPANPNLSDYMIPSIMDVPVALTSSYVESPDEDADLHGVGEMALPAVAPAIANAVRAATGICLTELPLTPERVLRALDKADEAGS